MSFHLERKGSLFKKDGLEKLSFEYVPPYMPHREDKIDYLVKVFKIIVENPGAFSQRILITGLTGTGKTATAKRVGRTLEKIAKEHNLKLKYVHVNCRLIKSKFSLVQEIIRQVTPNFPLRGYGAIELLYALWDFLNKNEILLLLALDEIDHYIENIGEDIVYELTRLTDTSKDTFQRINFIFIARNDEFMQRLSPETLSKFRPQERLQLLPYTEEQLRDIISNRVEEAFIEGSVSQDIIDFIARNASAIGHGDARYAIQLILTAGLIANRERSSYILPEHVREAQERTDPRVKDEDIILLPKDLKYVLLAIARYFKIENESIFVPFKVMENFYKIVCEEYKIKPVSSYLFKAFLKDLQTLGVIKIDNKFRIELPYVKASLLENFLMETLNLNR
ncbi:MAG: AAA family ATPase [Candidatus Bathyarchaeia archaeon]